jgi:ABC-2 type transport system ATP-binding protein
MTGMGSFAAAKVRTFSFGMRQRLALATALLGEPTVLILDEPANGLDPAGVAWLRDLLRRYADSGGAVLMSSHILSEVAEVADRVVVIDRGRLLTQGSVTELTAAAGERVLVRSPSAAALRADLERAGAAVTEEPGGLLAVRNLPVERVGEIAAEGRHVLHELHRETSSLEDAFLALTRSEEPTPARPDPSGDT